MRRGALLSVGLFRASYGPGQFEAWRNRFLQYLSKNLTSREHERTTVVFDAPAGGRNTLNPVVSHGLQVIYAQTEMDADDVLEELIAKHSAPRQILLVSSDHRLQKAARRRRGKFIDSEDFATRLEQRDQREDDKPADGPPRQKFTGLLSKSETSAWLDFFGEIPEAEQLRPDPFDENLDRDIEKLQREIDDEAG